MLDFNQPLRRAIFQSLEGQLTWPVGQTPVAVHDEKQKKSNSSDNYVSINTLRSTQTDTFNGWKRDFSFLLDIVTFTSNSVSHDICDTIAGQILAILIPTQQTNGLTEPAEFQYNNLRLENDDYIDLALADGKCVVRRLLRLSLTVNQR